MKVLNLEQRKMCVDQHFCLGFMASMVKKPFTLLLLFLPKESGTKCNNIHCGILG